MKRKLIGRASGAVSRQRIYRIPDGLEVDDIDHYEVTRRRVFFDEVTAITYHKQIGWIVALVFGLPALFLLTLAIIFAVAGEATPALVSGALAALFAIPSVIKLIVPAHVVTVFGKRTKAAMRFSYRHARAREIFDELVAEVRQRHDRLAAERSAVPVPSTADDFPRPEGIA